MLKKCIVFLILIPFGTLFAPQSKFLLILGPSGTGKSTIIHHLKKFDGRFEYITPLTTRELREGETDKIHVSEEEISRLKQAGHLLTVNNIYGICYATPKKPIDEALQQNRFPVLDWPIEKIEIMKKHYGSRLFTVYVQPDNLEELKDRLLRDNRDKDGKRYAAGIQEMSNFFAGNYDHLIDLKVVNSRGRAEEISRVIYDQFLTCTASSVNNKVRLMKPENLPKFKFKRDSYARRRGTPKMLSIFCSACNNYIMSYQKDGPGPLLRCYIDRIHYPEKLEKRQHEAFNKKTAPHLVCDSCNTVIGSPIVYESEDRPAYHMRPGFFVIEKDSE